MKNLLKEPFNTPMFLRDIWKNHGSPKAWMVACYFMSFPGYYFLKKSNVISFHPQNV